MTEEYIIIILIMLGCIGLGVLLGWSIWGFDAKYYKNLAEAYKKRLASPDVKEAILEKREILLKELEYLYNTLGIDTEFSTPDYLLAEYTLNCLVSYGDAITKNIEKGYIKPSLS